MSESSPLENVANGVSYSDEFFLKIAREGRASADVIAPLAMSLFAPQSVVDVGCGPGEWLASFERLGVKRILGLDGEWVDRDRLAIDPQVFQTVDLKGEWSIPAKFDLAICLEVAEHLSESNSIKLVKQLVGAAPAILFSAALPGQQGTDHINEQWPEYWQKLFGQFGYVCLDPFRRHIWQNRRVAWYYQQNLYAYVDPRLVEASPLLSEELKKAQECVLTLVHRKILRPMKRARPALQILAPLVRAAVCRKWNSLLKR